MLFRSFDAAARLFGFVQGAVDEALAAKAGIDAHDEDEVDVVNQLVEHVQRGGGVEGQAGAAACGADGLHAAVRVGS